MRQDRLKGIFGGSRALLDAPWGDFQGHFSAENASDASNLVLSLMPHALAAEVAKHQMRLAAARSRHHTRP